MVTMLTARAALVKRPVWLCKLHIDRCALEWKATSAGSQTLTHNPSSVLSIPFGASAAVSKISQSFTVGDNCNLLSWQVWLLKYSTPVDAVKAEVYSDNAGAPGSLLYTATNTLTASGTFTFTAAALTAATVYHLVVTRTGAYDAAKYWGIKTSGTEYAGANFVNFNVYRYLNTVWTEYVDGGDTNFIITLSGVKCMYTGSNACCFTYTSCQEKNSYVKSTRIYQFCSRGAKIPGALPYLTGNFTKLPTRIDSKRAISERGEVRIELSEDDPGVFIDPEKTTSPLDTMVQGQGRFWPRFMARNPNSHGRIVEIYRGFADVDPSLWELYFKGYIDDIDQITGGVEIRALDLLNKLTDVKCPTQIDSAITLTSSYQNASIMHLVDATPFDKTGTVKIEDEYIIYTGKGTDGTTLTGCAGGKFGSTVKSHAKAVKVAQALVYGYETAVPGLGGDYIFMDLLARAGIEATHVSTVTRAITLATDIQDDSVSLTVSDATYLPNKGIIVIDTESIYYASRVGTILSNLTRGAFGTTPADHTAGADVLINIFTSEFYLWNPDALYRAKIEGSRTVNEILSVLQSNTLCDIWLGEDGLIYGKVQSSVVLNPAGTIQKRDLKSDVPPKITRDEESRVTRVLVYYDAIKPGPGSSAEGYKELCVYTGAELESTLFYNEEKPKELWGEFIYQREQALWLAGRYWSRFKGDVRKLEFELELMWDSLRTGDYIPVSIPEVPDNFGNPATKFYQVVQKTLQEDNSIKLELLTLGSLYEGGGGGVNPPPTQYTLLGPVHPTLAVAIASLVITTVDIDLTASGLTIADWRAANGVINIEGEQIKYITLTDLGSNIIRATGCTRGFNGTTAAVHGFGVDVMLMYSAASVSLRALYVWQGDGAVWPPTNKLDGDGDGVVETDGYLML